MATLHTYSTAPDAACTNGMPATQSAGQFTDDLSAVLLSLNPANVSESAPALPDAPCGAYSYFTLTKRTEGFCALPQPAKTTANWALLRARQGSEVTHPSADARYGRMGAAILQHGSTAMSTSATPYPAKRATTCTPAFREGTPNPLSTYTGAAEPSPARNDAHMVGMGLKRHAGDVGGAPSWSVGPKRFDARDEYEAASHHGQSYGFKPIAAPAPPVYMHYPGMWPMQGLPQVPFGMAGSGFSMPSWPQPPQGAMMAYHAVPAPYTAAHGGHHDAFVTESSDSDGEAHAQPHSSASSPGSDDGDGTTVHTCSTPGCGAMFKRRYDLSIHQRVHTNERPFACPMAGCTSAFKTAGACVAHVRTHTGEKPFRCPYPECHARFGQKSSCNRHVRLRHSEWTATRTFAAPQSSTRRQPVPNPVGLTA